MSIYRQSRVAALVIALAAGCVDVPDPAAVDGQPMDRQVASDRSLLTDAGPDTAADADPDVAPLDMAPLDMARLDMARLDMDARDMAPLDTGALDMRPLDMASLDMLPPDAEPDAAVDMRPADAAPADMGPHGPLAFSDCLPLVDNGQNMPENLSPCLQVAFGQPMPERLSWREAVPLSDGRVAFIGGLRSEAGGGMASDRFDIYDPQSNTWVARPTLPGGHWAHAVARVSAPMGEGILTFGGAGDTDDEGWTSFDDVKRWQTGDRGGWTPFGGRIAGGVAEAAAWSDGDRAWLTGGHSVRKGMPSAVTAAWVFDGGPILGEPLTEARYGHAMVGFNGMPIVIGGANANQLGINSAEILGPDGWERIGDDRLRRVHLAAAVVGNRIIVAGGRSHALDYLPDGGPPAQRFAETSQLRQAAGAGWQVEPGPDMHRARFGFGLKPIGDGAGYALAVGGEAPAEGRPVLAEVYDNGAGQPRWWGFELPPPADRVRSHHAMAALDDGTVVVAGGVWSDAPDNIELFMDQTLVFRLGERADAIVPDGVQ